MYVNDMIYHWHLEKNATQIAAISWQLTAVLEDRFGAHAGDNHRLELRALAGLGAEEEPQLRLLLERFDEEALAVPAGTSQAQCRGRASV